MINKEIVMAFTLWVLAAFGFSQNNESKAEAVAVNPMKVVVHEVRATETNEAAAPRKILTQKFFFNQRDEKVERLQEALGAHVDGHYGKFTREAHIQMLQDLGLSTDNVPALPSPLVDDGGKRYEISKDPTHRCPEFEPLFKKYGLEPVEVFSYIAYRESRCNPKAANAKWDSKGNLVWTLNKDGSIDRGLLQINSCWKTVTANVCGTGLEGLFNVDCNLKVAKYIMDNSSNGLGNWNIWGK